MSGFMKVSEPFFMLFLYIPEVFHNKRLKEVPVAMRLSRLGEGQEWEQLGTAVLVSPVEGRAL